MKVRVTTFSNPLGLPEHEWDVWLWNTEKHDDELIAANLHCKPVPKDKVMAGDFVITKTNKMVVGKIVKIYEPQEYQKADNEQRQARENRAGQEFVGFDGLGV